MKKIAIQLVTLGLAALLLSSCEKDLTIPFPVKAPQLVVNSGANPDSTWKVYVGTTSPIFKREDPNDIDNASVTIKTDTGDILLQYQGNGYYTAPTKPEIGKTYGIEVSVPGMASASASCSIPSRPTFSDLSFTKITENGIKKVRVTLSIDDPADTQDYYIIEVRDLVQQYMYPEAPPRLLSYSLSTMDLFCENSSLDSYSYQLLYHDITFNGEKREVQFTIDQDINPTTSTQCVVKRCSKEFWEFKRTLAIYNNTFDSPFTQPTQIFSNIANGVGIFGAFASTVQSFPEKI